MSPIHNTKAERLLALAEKAETLSRKAADAGVLIIDAPKVTLDHKDADDEILNLATDLSGQLNILSVLLLNKSSEEE